ncbi:MAG: hypothetical protein NC915_05905 [Candidatus Omnitrophica bacterium]|nr:hypothetical protein [Candidatus Omnitrophota bacterium]
MIKEIHILSVLVTFVFLMGILTNILYRIKRKKGFCALVLTLIFSCITGYYIYLILYEKPISFTFEKYEKQEKVIVKPKFEKYKKPVEIFIIFKINDADIKVGIEDEIEIKKNTTFMIKDIEGIDKENLKINFVGFVGNKKSNDGQDMGYKINYKDIRKDKEIDKDKYKIEIKKDDKKIGTIFVKFVD